MAVHKQLWPIIAIFLLLALVACSSGFDAKQAGQANVKQTPVAKTTSSTAAKATPSTTIQINIVGKPSVPTLKPSPTAKPSVPLPGTGNNSSSPTPTSQAHQLAQYVFGLINHDRVAMGLPASSWSNALAGGAHQHNLRMMAYGQLTMGTVKIFSAQVITWLGLMCWLMLIKMSGSPRILRRHKLGSFKIPGS